MKKATPTHTPIRSKARKRRSDPTRRIKMESLYLGQGNKKGVYSVHAISSPGQLLTCTVEPPIRTLLIKERLYKGDSSMHQILISL